MNLNALKGAAVIAGDRHGVCRRVRPDPGDGGGAGPGTRAAVGRSADIRSGRDAVRRRQPGGPSTRSTWARRPRRQGRHGRRRRIDQKIAAMLGTARRRCRSPISRPSERKHVSCRSCAARAPTRSRRCCASTATARSSRRADNVKFSKVDAAQRAGRTPTGAATARRRDHRHGVQRRQAVVAGLSNEEFARSCARCPIRSSPSTPAPASRSSTATTASSRRGRRSTPSSPTRSTTSRTSLPAISARRW